MSIRKVHLAEHYDVALPEPGVTTVTLTVDMLPAEGIACFQWGHSIEVRPLGYFDSPLRVKESFPRSSDWHARVALTSARLKSTLLRPWEPF